MAPVFLGAKDSCKGTFKLFPLSLAVQCSVKAPAEDFTMFATTGRSHVQLFGNPGFEFSPRAPGELKHAASLPDWWSVQKEQPCLKYFILLIKVFFACLALKQQQCFTVIYTSAHLC